MIVKKYNDKKCAPGLKYTDGSCFTHASLIKIAKKYNEKYNINEINLDLSKEKLVIELYNRLKDKCSEQRCWLNLALVQAINDEQILFGTFLPDGPEGKFEWLSTNDINSVLEQYHNVHDDFVFLGAVPYDFEDLAVLEINSLNFSELERLNKKKIGMVINLDEHYKSGSHWVALYINLEKNQIYYFDSVGKLPGRRIKKFINRIVKYLYKKKYNDKININNLFKYFRKRKNSDNNNLIKDNKYLNNLLNDNFDIKYNNIQHQFKNSECGVYSINFIIRLISGENFNDIIF